MEEGAHLAEEAGEETDLKELAAEVDRMGEIQKAHRQTCSNTNSLHWTRVPNQPMRAKAFAAFLCFRLAHPLDVVPSSTMCAGCKNVFTAREYTEHIVGCTSLPGPNATSTHGAVCKGLMSLARSCLVSYIDQPPYSEVTRLGRDGKPKRPDITFFLESTTTVDVKGINPAAKSEAVGRILLRHRIRPTFA
eukprot:PhF_6_TR25588/c1_g1_i7/m.35887